MTLFITLISILTAAFLLFLLSLSGRRGHPGLSSLRGWSYAHRGLHGNGVPENSMAAFRAALDAGYGIELDVHLMRDGELAVIHDPSLKRTAGADVQIEDLTTADLASYPLEGTQETIPTFRQVLELYAGKAPLIIELKPERGNHAALAEAVCKMLADYSGAYCIESFDPRCVYWLRKNRPEVIRGQLTEDFLHNPRSTLPWAIKFALTHQIINFLTQPDFIAYKFADRNTLSVKLCRDFWGIQGVTWTLRTQDEYHTAVEEKWIPIFESFTP